MVNSVEELPKVQLSNWVVCDPYQEIRIEDEESQAGETAFEF